MTPESSAEPAVDTAEPNSEQRTLALLAHLLGIFTLCIYPLVIYLLNKKEGQGDTFVVDQAREALNFQILFFIVSLVVGVVSCGVGNWVVTPIGVIFAILAGIAAWKGQRYRYPVNWRIIS